MNYMLICHCWSLLLLGKLFLQQFFFLYENFVLLLKKVVGVSIKKVKRMMKMIFFPWKFPFNEKSCFPSKMLPEEIYVLTLLNIATGIALNKLQGIELKKISLSSIMCMFSIRLYIPEEFAFTKNVCKQKIDTTETTDNNTNVYRLL